MSLNFRAGFGRPIREDSQQQLLTAKRGEMRHVFVELILVAGLVVATRAGASADKTLSGTAVQLSGVFQAGNLSGVCRIGDFLVVGADEGELKDGVDTRKVQVLRRDGENYVQAHDVILPAEGTTEIDIEGIACDGSTVYVIGSHSTARSKVNEDRKNKPYNENLDRLKKTKAEASRDALYRFTLADDGTVTDPSKIVRTNLRSVLENEEVLKKALDVPSKENGVDIEGLAVKGEHLYVAFRGPVLREGWVPILAIGKPGESPRNPSPKVAERYFVNLGGLGIRDIASVDDGFLLIAGPVGDGPPDFRLYLWDGKDMVPGQGSPGGSVRLLGNFAKGSGKAEGLAVLTEKADHYKLLVLYDDSGLKDDATVATGTVLKVPKH